MSRKLEAERILAERGVKIVLRDYHTDAELTGSLHDYLSCELFVVAIFGRVLDTVQYKEFDTLITCPGIFSGEFQCTSEISIQSYDGETVYVGLPSSNDICIQTNGKVLSY